MNESHLPDEIKMTGKMNGREFDLQLGPALEASVIFDCQPAMLQVEVAKKLEPNYLIHLRTCRGHPPDFPGPLVCWNSTGEEATCDPVPWDYTPRAGCTSEGDQFGTMAGEFKMCVPA